jgi:hypothetical protein
MKSTSVKSRSSAKHKKKSVLNKTIGFFLKSPFRAYLVGGFVRDTSLGVKIVDIDIVVEGSAIKAAQALNEKLHGELITHKKFGTASITTNSMRVDLASARVEKYPKPATLPHVYPSTIIEDLNRRDFTINAMAMSISKENFGEIFDPFNGLDDIKKNIIRVLHANSFVDDPTRIFRAVRYKNRFNFKIEKRTKALIKEAVQKKMVKRLTGQRLLNELRLIFGEESYRESVKDMIDLDIFTLKRKDLEMLPNMGQYKMYFFISCLGRINLPLSTDERRIMRDINKVIEAMPRIRKASKNSTLYNLLSPIPRDILKIISQIKPDLEKKIKQYSRIARIKPFITGSDLKRLRVRPQKKYASILKKMYNMQLDKRITTRRQALTYIRTSR